MPKLKSALILIIALLVLAMPLAAGCGEIKEYSDPVTENILVSMNNEDYAGFSKDFDDAMKAELSEDSFPALLGQITGQIGKYEEGSKKFLGFNSQNGITTANYSADFENAADVKVEVSFQKVGEENKVVGLWFK